VIYTFDRFQLDEQRWELRHGAARIRLAPRELELLHYLMRHRDRVVSKEELIQQVWSGIPVGAGALLRSMSLLRRALGQRDARDGIIRTYTRRGYRFCVSVRGDAADT